MQPTAEHAAFPEDIQMTAWAIAAKHLTRGQKDVTKMIADALVIERTRCVELMHAALGPDDPLVVFLANPSHDW
ncbi:hypothetical protein LH464_13905 [Neorhizobium sp. T786]|uniref:hypothetical protein n=1 Tax=Pseudorhizobium xiangyangii TaxID=2883104 RepID=UPI001CFF676B|nr:hypothetical protein [Neorhizobium xiangyangii]MCB5203567.1 hypothetical protein [Neorhizobium xiangyangii]